MMFRALTAEPELLPGCSTSTGCPSAVYGAGAQRHVQPGRSDPAARTGRVTYRVGSPVIYRVLASTRPAQESDVRQHRRHLRPVRRSRTARPTSAGSSSTGCRPAPTGRPTATRCGDRWESVTWSETGDRVTGSRPACWRSGIEPEQRVGIASGTRYEWILADLAIMCAGGATTTVYPSTNGRGRRRTSSADSECRVVFAEDDAQIAKLTEHARPSCRTSTKVVTFDGTADGDWVIALDDLADARRRAASPSTPDVVEERIAAIRPDALATLIYTSGTTGRPKGVRLRHQLLDLRGRGDPGAGHPLRGRPAVPLAADGALLRQGAALRAARVRLRDRGRRPGRQDHRQPRRGEARRSWAPPRASSRRRTAGSSRCRPPRAG